MCGNVLRQAINYYVLSVMISLKDKFPNLAKEWHPNNSMGPDEVSYGSQKKVLWICDKGHEYEAIIIGRSRGRSNCHYCSGHRVLKGFNDVATTHPEILYDWSINNTIQPTEVSAGSAKKILWKCFLDHEYSSNIPEKLRGRGCPYCSGRKVLRGFNDFATKYPELVKWWSPNNSIKPYEITYGSHKNILWNCALGHEYECSAYNKNRSNCPYCSGKKILVGFNDLGTTHPYLTEEWSNNNLLSIKEVSSGSNKKYLWNCKIGHEYSMTPNQKTRKGVGEMTCPYCLNVQALPGFNGLGVTHPHLKQEWSPKNLKSFEEILYGNNKKVWWICPQGHEYEAVVFKRTMRGHGCPYCSGHRVWVGFNDLLTTHPALAKQWSDKNIILPTEISAGSPKKVWRKCPIKKHEDFKQRLTEWRRNGCPQCSIGYTISKGEQEVANFVKSMGFVIEQSNRKIVSPYEIDIWIPAINLAIEYNGEYYHSDKFPHRQANDKKKAKMCYDRKIRFMVIREQNWLKSTEYEKKRITRLCGKTML